MTKYALYSISEKEIKQWLEEDGIKLECDYIDGDRGVIYFPIDKSTIPDEYNNDGYFDQYAFLGKHIVGRMCKGGYGAEKRYPDRPMAYVFCQDGDQRLPGWFMFAVDEAQL